MATLHPLIARAARSAFALLFVQLVSTASATILVNPARPITKQLDVQIIQTARDNGSSPATIFGDATQRADIEAGLDLIWSQAGIDINFLPTITNYSNTFAFQGSIPLRPQTDLGFIIANALTAGKLNPNNKVINMFFVEVVPGYSQLTQLQVAGIANIDGNGMAIFTGETLLGSAANRELIAGVVGHEIGHNLGLSHTAERGDNLMSPKGTSERLTTQQINTVLSSSFLVNAAPGGDFNGDGIVNQADLTLWRGAYGINANGDADGDGDTDGRDFMFWQKQYGTSTLTSLQNVPEPASIWLAIGCGLALAGRTRKRMTGSSR
jgi:hypothetical protein